MRKGWGSIKSKTVPTDEESSKDAAQMRLNSRLQVSKQPSLMARSWSTSALYRNSNTNVRKPEFPPQEASCIGDLDVVQEVLLMTRPCDVLQDG